MIRHNIEEIFDEKIVNIMSLLDKDAGYDLVIGIPFFKETKELPDLLEILDKTLQNLIGKRYLIVSAGDYFCKETLTEIKKLQLKNRHIEYLMPIEISGRGRCIRTFIEIATNLEADLVLLNAEADVRQSVDSNVLFFERLLAPINGIYDLVFGSGPNHFGINSSGPYFTIPILESIYGLKINNASEGVYVIEHDLVEELAEEAKFWSGFIDGYGFDFWLITRASIWNKKICEVQLFTKAIVGDSHQANLVFYENAIVVAECIKRDQAFWFQDGPTTKSIDMIERCDIVAQNIAEYPIDELLREFRRLNNEFLEEIEGSFPASMTEEIKMLCAVEPEEFYLKDEIWVNGVYNLLLKRAYGENGQISKSMYALTALYNGVMASNILQMNSFEEKIKVFEKDDYASLKMQKINLIHQQILVEFCRQKPEIIQNWIRKADLSNPRLIPSGYMEYVPGKSIVFPKEIKGKDQRIAYVDSVFASLRNDYEKQFESFIINGLGLTKDYDPEDAVAGVSDFMEQLENNLDQLLPGDLTTKEGITEFSESIFSILPQRNITVLSETILRETLVRHPPRNLMISMQYDNIPDLIANIDIRDIISYANMVDNRNVSDNFLKEALALSTPSEFEIIEIAPLIITEELPFNILYHPQICYMNRLTGRLSIQAMEKGKGGKYPKLRYFTAILRSFGIATQFSSFVEQIIREGKNIGNKILNAMINSRQGGDFSANNLYEDLNHQELIEIVRYLAKKQEAEGNFKCAHLFELVVEGYGLSQVLSNGVYLTCTAWTWATYSFKGGKSIPNPVASDVEVRRFNYDFIKRMYRELGYNQNEIIRRIYRYVEQGKGEKTLLDSLMSAPPKNIDVVLQTITNEPSKPLERYSGNPILEPILENSWESKYVLNPGALRIKDKVYLFYRAVGEDGISRIGLAITDGYKVLKRFKEPIFVPILEQEKQGCEDPRLVIIDDRIWMMYTAYDGIMAQLAVASIKIDDFLHNDFDLWRRDGFPFENVWDKDGILFPEKIQGKYVLYHRIDPSIWAAYVDELVSKDVRSHFIIMGPRPGHMWDSMKIGAGSQPIKTKYGWLLIYHGVDYSHFYRLGVILVDLKDAHQVLYRSPNAVLEPIKDYEIGDSGAWVPNVVFTCGAVGAVDKPILDANDEVLVYYGAADTSIGMAKATVADLIPEKYRIDLNE